MLAARNGSVIMSSDQEKDLTELIREAESKKLNKEMIRRLEITFLIMVAIGLLIMTRVWD